MKISHYIGLQFFELSYLAVLAIVPFFLVQGYVGIVLLSVGALYGCLRVIKNQQGKRIPVTGQGVVITGCDTGFGHELAKRLDTIGFTVFAGCLYENGEGAQKLKSSTSGRLHVLALDVRSDESVSAALQLVEKHCSVKGLWGVVNNAGVPNVGNVEFQTMEMYRRVTDVNLFGLIRVTKAFLPLIRKTKGRVVNVTSVKGRMYCPFDSAYISSKHAGEAFSDILRIEIQQFGVKVVIIEPGNFGGATGMLNEHAVATLTREVDEMWTNASEDVKLTYGKKFLSDLLEGAKASASTTYPTLTPTVDAMENALVLEEPAYRYLVDGSNQWFDKYCVLARLNPYLPERWMDRLTNYFFGFVQARH